MKMKRALANSKKMAGVIVYCLIYPSAPVGKTGLNPPKAKRKARKNKLAEKSGVPITDKRISEIQL